MTSEERSVLIGTVSEYGPLQRMTALPQDAQTFGGNHRSSIVGPDLVASLGPTLIAWQRTREAIGRLEVSQPRQITEAMAELIAARRDMEIAVSALINPRLER